MTFNSPVRGVQVIPLLSSQQAEILSPDALSFLATLQRTFDPVRRLLLQRRALRQQEIDQGILPHFLPETAAVRKNPTWKAAPPAPGLLDRRVEITGPVDRKMVINALNSGAKTFMADFEDSTAPTWDNVVDGQVNLRDAVARTLTFTHSNGKVYKLRDDGRIATLIIRPRGWHLEEKHVVIDGRPCSASLFDFALYFFHNAKKASEMGFGPYFYLPKIESHLEARLWNDVFNLAQDMLAVPRGTIRGTVLIETVLAAFEMDEILFELREHSSGLNCGRWDYIFSFIKKFRQHAKYVLPDRSDISMTAPFMDAYVRLLIQTCHRRGVHAMGGMAAQIPIKDDPVANRVSMDKVRADKQREVTAGHDGTWVAHPDLVKIATEVFDEHMVGPNQLHVRRPDVFVSAGDLLNTNVPGGKITLKGIRANVSVGLTYMESWLRGVGCVPIHHLMEDAATAEISRSQLWQWVRHGARTEEGGVVIPELVLKTLDEEMEDVKKRLGEVKFAASRYEIARKYMAREIVGKEYADFITTLLYDEIAVIPGKSRL